MCNCFSKHRSAAAVAGITALVVIPATIGAPIYDSAGFGSRFTPDAPLQTQDATQGPWRISSNLNPASATVGPNVGVGAGNGVEVTVAGGQTNTQWYVSKPIAPLANVSVSWDMNVPQTNVAGLQYGPFFGVEMFDATSTLKQIGGFGVDASTGDLLILTTDRSNTIYAPLATPQTVEFGLYHSFGINVDFSTKRYTVLLNGTPLDSRDFVNSAATTFTDAPITTRFLSNLGEQPLNAGVADFDNYVTATGVPEPTIVGGFVAIFLGITSRRR